MATSNPSTMYAMTKRNPYDPEPADERRPRNRIVRAGMSVAEMVVWLVIMAALAIGMLAMLWNVSK
ncbi:hypothetical protein [Collinsella intestinalis]|uniref:hypothetical protein n=1 Tax=Collinsella intestinalis TaxID=147207 RepID=UPI00195C7DE0|nr:hypothetical protein [Collinsella intestinalis]MBM6682902.1 hypothetical protein [Collinsella intestinalis]